MADHKDLLEELFEENSVAEEDLVLPLRALAPMVPPPGLRARVLASARASGRLHRFADLVAEALDVTGEKARSYLDGVDDPNSFEPSLLPQATIFHVRGGAQVAGAITGFIRMPAGSAFPTHRHEGDEIVIVVQGRFVEDGGEEAGPGDVRKRPSGSTHSFTVLPGPDLVYLAVLFQGLWIGDDYIKAGDPGI